MLSAGGSILRICRKASCLLLAAASQIAVALVCGNVRGFFVGDRNALLRREEKRGGNGGRKLISCHSCTRASTFGTEQKEEALAKTYSKVAP